MLVENQTHLYTIIQLVFQFLFFIIVVYNFIFFIWILSSWLPVNRSIIILKFVDNLINPVYYTLLKILPPLRIGVMDFSPFYMFIFLSLLEYLVQGLYTLVMMLLTNTIG